MRRKTVGKEEEPEINMTPMLDIVFIMLIFFIVTAVFVKEAGIDVTKPEVQTAEDIKRVSALIAISEENEIWINKTEVELRDVRAVVERLRKENPQGQFVVQSDAKSESGVVVDVLDQLNEAGIRGVAISTVNE